MGFFFRAFSYNQFFAIGVPLFLWIPAGAITAFICFLETRAIVLERNYLRGK